MKAHGAKNQVITSLKPQAGQPAAKWLLAGILALLLITTIGTVSAATTVPDAPTDLTAVADTNTDPQAAIALNWTPSASDGGSEITGHEYRWNAGNANWWTDWTAIPDSKPADANATSYTVTGTAAPQPTAGLHLRGPGEKRQRSKRCIQPSIRHLRRTSHHRRTANHRRRPECKRRMGHPGEQR